MIQITEAAAKKIQALKSEDKMPADSLLRVRIEKGGCSGFSYKLDFDSKTTKEDKIFEFHNTKVVIDTKSMLYVLGMTLDYEGGLNGAGFVFNNPNAVKKCSCGSSFAV